jgi:bla regulator protein blaR1
MPDFLLYIIEIGVSIFLFYTIFWLFLKSETYFTVNRYYISLTLLASLLVPLVNVTLVQQSTDISYYNLISTVVITADGIEHAVKNHLSSSQILFYTYLFGVFVFLIRFIYQITNLFIVVWKSEVKNHGTLKYVLTEKHYAPFSFFNYIFISKKLESESFKKILIHESIHAKQWHSIDIIILEMLAILQWFNPFIWFYKNSMQEVHEYLADRGVLKKGYDPKEYQQLIYNQVFGINGVRLANSLNYSLTKRRFLMMTKIKSPKSAILRVFLLVPVISLVVLAFSCSNSELKEPNILQVEDSKEKVDTTKVYEQVDEMPAFPGGTAAIIKFISNEVRYPEAAKELGVQGKVFISFVVGINGSVESVEVVRGITDDYIENKIKNAEGISEFDAAKLIEQEAVRVISALPDWTPGKVEDKIVKVLFTVPISFKLD